MFWAITLKFNEIYGNLGKLKKNTKKNKEKQRKTWKKKENQEKRGKTMKNHEKPRKTQKNQEKHRKNRKFVQGEIFYNFLRNFEFRRRPRFRRRRRFPPKAQYFAEGVDLRCRFEIAV